ncbi:glycosyltransferase [Rhodococcoides corynebacterioides]|uniref:glycosyltransferase n=1 Tax=Rhodococcoides corynebacterioides TaxID=53972 RepID=UPI00082969C7|nr:glycosyltransferase family 2 protein [Rhodococcus corynebacterioides]
MTRSTRRLAATLVIPAYNEEATIGICLDHALAQTRPFERIIVVDNSSTDRTADIVRDYRARSPRIELMTESRRGVLHARTTGFDAVDTDVIARIDADTRLRPEWCAAGLDLLESDVDEKMGSVTGPAVFYDAPLQRRAERKIFEKYRIPVSSTIISGNNTMIRRVAWEAARGSLSGRTDIHEDGELGVWIRKNGYQLILASSMMTDISPRRIGSPPWQSMKYYWANVRTHEVAGDPEQARRLRRIMPLVAVWSVLLWFVYGAWDPTAKRWTLHRLLVSGDRVSPLQSDRSGRALPNGSAATS